jgi:catechol 2,3-dioxygenase-like lactoylglutathione lyase family enzyme
LIKGLSHTVVHVLDQDRALQFYTERLGFEVRMDSKLDGFRWLTVGPKEQADVSIMIAVPAPPMFSAEDGAAVKELVAKGVFCGGVFETSNCRVTYDELRSKGVTFLQEPADRPYAIEAVFRDDSGNWFSLTQPKPSIVEWRR